MLKHAWRTKQSCLGPRVLTQIHSEPPSPSTSIAIGAATIGAEWSLRYAFVLFVIGTLAFPVTATGIFEAAKIWVTVRFDWFFILTAGCTFPAAALLFFVIRYGSEAAKGRHSFAERQTTAE